MGYRQGNTFIQRISGNAMRLLFKHYLLITFLICYQQPGNAEPKYQFYQLLQESEVVIDITDGHERAFNPSIEVQIASFKERVAADFVQHNLSEDFASLALKVKIVPTRSYFAVRVHGFKDSRTVAHVIDQLVKAGFAPLKIQPK